MIMKNKGPGRPKYRPNIPKGKFTFTDFEIANGVNPKTGKGKDCTTLTLRKWLKEDLSKRGHSTIVHLKDTFAEPTGKGGLGRKQYVYQRRAGVSVKAVAHAPETPAAGKSKATRKPRTVTVKVDKTDIVSVDSGKLSPETESYESQKAELLAPVVDIAPAPLAVDPPAMVDKTESTESPVAETAEEQPPTEPAETAPQPIPEAAPALVG
jgi:hypothetical protein